MGKYIFWFVVALTVTGVIIWLNWDSIFWNFLKPTEQTGMLPLLSGLMTTVLTLIVAIASLAIAYKNHLSNNWKPDIRFELCQVDENGVKPHVNNWTIPLTGLIFSTYMLSSKIFKVAKNNKVAYDSEVVGSMIVRVQIKNIGKAEMRFNNPRFDDYTFLPNPVLLEKNGIPDENYFRSKVLDLKSGEIVELYYTLTALQKYALSFSRWWKASFNESKNFPCLTFPLLFRIVDAENRTYSVKYYRRLRIFAGSRWVVSDPHSHMVYPVEHEFNIEQRGRQKAFDLLLAGVKGVDLTQIHRNSHRFFSYLVTNGCWTIQDNHYELNQTGSIEDIERRKTEVKELISSYSVWKYS